jgi:hypothetical protein
MVALPLAAAFAGARFGALYGTMRFLLAGLLRERRRAVLSIQHIGFFNKKPT